MIQQLAAMGFAEEACKKAVFHNPNSADPCPSPSLPVWRGSEDDLLLAAVTAR
jgi:hypothetical protein